MGQILHDPANLAYCLHGDHLLNLLPFWGGGIPEVGQIYMLTGRLGLLAARH